MVGIIDNNFDIEQSPKEPVSRDNIHFLLDTYCTPRLLIILLLYSKTAVCISLFPRAKQFF